MNLVVLWSQLLGLIAPYAPAGKTGNQGHIGMKAHIGVDSDSGLVHTVTTTPANGHDVTQAHALLHGQ